MIVIILIPLLIDRLIIITWNNCRLIDRLISIGKNLFYGIYLIFNLTE